MYGGYCFISKSEKEESRRKYRTLSDAIKRKKGVKGELKANNSNIDVKRRLYNVMKDYDRVYVAVDISKVHSHILEDKKSIQRYKDYILKRIIKNYVQSKIKSKELNPNEELSMIINIDNQNIATNGYYDLKSSIHEELVSGITNFDYSKTFQPILFNKLSIRVHYCDSEKNYLIQAADIYANRIWKGYNSKDYKLLKSKNCCSLTLP